MTTEDTRSDPEKWRDTLDCSLEHASHAFATLEKLGLAHRTNPDSFPPQVSDPVGSAAYHYAAMTRYVFEVHQALMNLYPEYKDESDPRPLSPKDYLKIRDNMNNQIKQAYNEISIAHDYVMLSDFPKHYRPAQASDIVVGAVIWYAREEQYHGAFWKIVDEVLRPDSDFKAYTGDDGCRYGLEGAYVETEE